MTEAAPVPYRDDLRRVERAGLSAWPALETAYVDGWVWRFSGGGYGRSNSVSTLDFDGPDLDAAIAKIERYYQFRNRRARFRVSDVSEPTGLGNILEARGYTPEANNLILAKAVESRKHDIAEIDWGALPSPSWLKVYLGVVDEPRRRSAPDILAAVPAPLAYFRCRKRGITLSCGLATIEDGIATLECIASREETRRRGGAKAILGGMETWARQEGAHTLHLQVAENNEAARALYSKFGFEQVGSYQYWVADPMHTAPHDFGDSNHLTADFFLPSVQLSSSSGVATDLSKLAGQTIAVFYPWTGRPGLANPSEWDELLGAHGSTPELEGFRNLAKSIDAQGIRVIAISSQSTEHQRELAERLRLPFDVLSDAAGQLREAWRLPSFWIGNDTFLSRMTLVLRDGRIAHRFFPVHPPATHARDVLDWIAANPG